MGRRNISKEELQKRMALADEQRNELRKTKQEYDEKFRKSFYFRLSFVIRIISIVFSVCVVVLGEVDFDSKYDQIVSSKVEQQVVISNIPKLNTPHYFDQYVHIATKSGGSYIISLGESGKAASFLSGDSILINYSLFNVPSYISTSDKAQYLPTKQFDFFRVLAIVLGVLSLLSVFIRSGFDKLSRYFVGFVTVLSTAVVVFYFFI